MRPFGRFLAGSRCSPNQIQFVTYIVDYLTQNGVMAPDLTYEAPCSDFSPRGLDGVFVEQDATLIVQLMREARDNAEGIRSA